MVILGFDDIFAQILMSDHISTVRFATSESLLPLG